MAYIDRASYWRNNGRLPGHASPAEILADCLDTLTPPDTHPPADIYVKRVEGGEPVRADRTPYMIEPLNMTVSRGYRGLGFVGPARTGKTFYLVEGTVYHRMIADPCEIHITQMDKVSAQLYSRQKIEKMIRHNPDLLKRLVARSGTLGNVFDKRFRGDGFLTIGWPSASLLASRDIPVTITTDRDRIDDDIDGEGDIWVMQKKRGQTFGSRSMALIESSPGRDILDENWSPSTPHEMPPCTGIVAIYNGGTRGRYYWRCPNCRERFEPTFGLLKWDEKKPIAEAAEGVWLACPKCGGEITASLKYRLNLEAQNDPDAGWLHEAEDGKDLVPITSDMVRRCEDVTYAINGCHAAYQTWPAIVKQFLTAQAEYELTGFEGSLKGVVNQSIGLPYLPKSRIASIDLTAQKLVDAADKRPLGELPEGTRFVTIQVDVQGASFICSAEAWGEGLEHWLVDRWAITQSEASHAARRPLQPHIYKEDWLPLEALHELPFRFEDGKTGLLPVAAIIDSGGMPGVTERAYAFWRKMHRKKLSGFYHLYKGVGGMDGPRAKQRQPDVPNQKKHLKRNDVQVVFVSTNRIKDEVVSGLLRGEPGPLSYHLPDTLERQYFEEFCAERRTDDGWEKKKGHLRNESLDLAVFAKALAIIKGAEGIRDWSKPPSWAAAGSANTNHIVFDEAGAVTVSAVKPKADIGALRKSFLKKG